MALIWGRGSCIFSWRALRRNASWSCGLLGRSGTEMRSGCWRPEAPLCWRFRLYMQHPSAAFILALVLWIGTIAASISVQPLLTQNFHARPWGAVFPIASFLAIFVSFSLHRRHMAGPAFLTSALSLYAMICSAAAGLYPYVLP